ncbi:MAG TPA: hypothetical protein VMW75_02600 [Thermoanaerobaculia bacterium]|nr:hypothetical protein [Thermoanaerobaculia bacterium]
MEAASFNEANKLLSRPPDLTADQCEPLSVLGTVTSDGVPVIISCWKPTRAELQEIERTGRVWLMVYGIGMPPVALCGVKPF